MRKLSNETKEYIRKVVDSKVEPIMMEIVDEMKVEEDMAKKLLEPIMKKAEQDARKLLKKARINPNDYNYYFASRINDGSRIFRSSGGRNYKCSEITNRIIAHLELKDIPPEKTIEFIENFPITRKDVESCGVKGGYYERVRI